MVESVVRYEECDSPTLVARYRVSGSEPVFAGVWPPSRWPSVHVIEGLGQACLILSVLQQSERDTAADNAERPAAIMSAPDMPPPGLLAAVSVEIQGVARPGDDLRYLVTRTHAVGELSRFSVSAYVESRLIASGTIVGAAGP